LIKKEQTFDCQAFIMNKNIYVNIETRILAIN